MEGRILAALCFVVFNSLVHAQLIDTLLEPFHSIAEIYPLEDSTYILIGVGDDILVEKRNHKSEVIWSTSLVSTNLDYFKDFKFDLSEEDSILQVLTAYKNCDLFGRSPYKAFTIDLSGNIRDIQFVPMGTDYNGIFLMSGQNNKPRLAYIRDKKLMLMQANGDTTQLKLTWEHGDTTNADIIGFPKSVAICPNGDLLVTDGFFVLVFQLLNNKYEVINVTIGNGSKAIHCLEDDYFITESQYGLELRNNLFPIASFETDYYALRRMDWRKPILSLQTSEYMGPDSIFFMTSKLELLHAEAIEDYHIGTKAIQDGITYSVGSGNLYVDGGLLVSERQDNHEGPKYYDVEIVDFEFGPFVNASWYKYGGGYYLEIPDATVAIKNNCSFPINQVNIFYSGRYSFCRDTIWEREITNMNLLPGESQSYPLKAIFIIQSYPNGTWDNTCLYVLMPDQHFDDYFEDNDFCKKLEFHPSPLISTVYTLYHYPAIVSNSIEFRSPINFDFLLTILNLNGIIVHQSEANTYSGYSVDLGFLPAGLYIFQYLLPDQSLYTEKIVKN
jgi:hypothetical protein